MLIEKKIGITKTIKEQEIMWYHSEVISLTILA